MGNNVTTDENKEFQDKLQFVQTNQDIHFGKIDIFRFVQPPYQYIMDYSKIFIEGDYRYTTYIEFMKKLEGKEHKNLAKIQRSQVSKENHMCIKDTKVHTYCNYYNFTLRQAIEKKKVRDCRFSEAQLTYILYCLVDVGIYLKGFDIAMGEYRSDKIFLSPEGYLKMYLMELEKDNKHIGYYKALVDNSVIDDLILAPQQLTEISKLEYEPKIDIYKADLFAIAMVILELMTLDKTKYYYNQNKTGLKMARIAFDLSSFSSDYSYSFIDILRSCLTENPEERSTFEEVSKKVQKLRDQSQNVNYCIRLTEDEENLNKKKTSMSKGQYILTGIEKRLTPSPISTLSATTTGLNSKYTSSSSNFYSQIKN